MAEAATPLTTGPASEPEDAELLRRFHRDQTQGAFAELVRRHLNMVYATALRRVGGDRQLAEEVAQNVFSDLARKAASLGGHPRLAGWLYRSACFAAAQVVRTERRRKTHEEEAQTMNELNSTPVTEWDRLRPVIDDAIEELDEADREMVVLRFFENGSLASVGAKFALSPDAARMRVARALEKLRTLLAKRGMTSTSAALAAALVAQAEVLAPTGLANAIMAGVVGSAGAAAGVVGAGKIATMTFGKILAGCLIGSLGVGLVTYQLVRVSPMQDRAASSIVSAPTGPEISSPAVPREAASNPPQRSEPNGKLSAGESRPRVAVPRIDALVARLDRLVDLTAAQKIQAAAIFTDENEGLQAFSSVEERVTKGAPIRQKARAQIRELLLPGQREIYNREPQRLGGGALQDPAAKGSRIDQVVGLSDEQLMQLAAISQRETDALLAIPAEDRFAKGAEIRQAAKEQLRALLTPEQQRKFDANPNGIEDLVERTALVSFIKTSPGVAARLGPVAQVTPVEVKLTSTRVNDQVYAMKGSYSYRVEGRAGTELLKIHWERGAPSAPIKVIKIESSTGETISP